MKNLIGSSICVSGITVKCWPQYGDKEETIDMTDIGSKFNGCYAINNSTICYVVDHEVFVTPYTRSALAILRNAGLVQRYFYVPFSNWDYPKYEKTKWEHLRELAAETYCRDYEEDSAEWCDKHHIGELSKETMECCFKIPRSGVPVKHTYFETTYYPACNEGCVDCTVTDRLGHYNANNGKVVFVYHDGHTYVAKGYWILDELRRAGYKESGLFVPFSNGEQIADSDLATQWEQIPKK